MTPIKIAFLLTIVAYTVASPIRSVNYPTTIIGIPIFGEESTDLKIHPEDDSSPIVYALLHNEQADQLSSGHQMEKRSAEESDLDDLETAAGTNALRPLFVYRQQVAYRQRVRDAIRRGNRF